MSDLQFNKLAGAVLATGLVIVGLSIGTEMLFEPDHAEKAGYAIAVALPDEGGGAASPELPPDWGMVLPVANVALGATVSNKCQSCHSFEKGGANGIGPNLWGVLGRDAGSVGGFAYSSGMVAHPVWDYANMDAFLLAPQRHIEGTKMSFVGLKKQDDRINMIAYLRTMADSAPPIPAPNPAAAAAPAGPGAGPTPNSDGAVVEGAAGVVPGESDRSAAGGAPAGGGVAGQAPTTGVGAAPTQEQSNPGG